MRICVYGAASTIIDPEYIKKTEELCYNLAKSGHNLVFGGGAGGLMGAAARGFKKGNAHIIGVIPKFFFETEAELLCDFCDTLYTPETMRERKQIMEDYADAFIITPGGIGTYEEFFEILTLKQLCRHNKPIAIYNINGFYNDMQRAMDSAIEKRFIKDNCKKLYLLTEDENELVNYLEGPQVTFNSVKDLKQG